VSSRLPNSASSRAINVDWRRPGSIQPKLIQERQSVPQHFGVNGIGCFVFRGILTYKVQHCMINGGTTVAYWTEDSSCSFDFWLGGKVKVKVKVNVYLYGASS